ncbi:sugar kinase [Pseudogracilibacillus auburnensis]|uniref:2-dehydro-3-deoxygluconokinase n=1 Tax=Pseudogracilibacillus auburnensis TaxID=1494959 RepID=A0A2V3W2I1_9BACI|nr:sugar kinase [Pseudogracilibacillus auburnensis]PXW87956.1 2-dehydro-3-deoxygluconokinase [Pseudogracilibacillus auburnensis]
MDKKIKAFGEVMMRLEVPNSLKLEQSHTLNVSYSGTGVNVLSALSKYGHQTSLITKLPYNSLGHAAISYIRSLGISTEDIIQGGEYLGMYFLEKGFSVRPTQVTYSNRKESSFCTSAMTDYNLETVFKDTKVIHFCGITLAISEQIRSIALQIAKRAKQLGITIIFDCNYRPKLWEHQKEFAKQYYEEMLQWTDICFMTEKDALYLLEIETTEKEQKKQLESLLPKVAEKYQIETIAGTIRENKAEGAQVIQGFMYSCSPSSFIYSRSYHHHILDRIGAGDGFASGIIHGIMNHFSVNDTIEFATASGVLAHTTYGDVPICSTKEVWSLLNKENRANIER